MSYRVRYTHDAPVAITDAGIELGVLAVFTTRVRGEVSHAFIPIPQHAWDWNEQVCKDSARDMARDVFERMKA